MSVGSPRKRTTPGEHNLREYVAFLRKHRFNEDADFYENDVVAVLKKAGIPDPISLSTREVVANLYGIIDAAEASAVANARPWEVQLVS